MRDGWQLFKIRGIPLRIHPTWFLILFAATLAFERHYRLALSESMGAAVIWFAAFITAVLLFVSVLLHELGHSLVALSQGVKVRSITLFLLGGVATVERDCPTALGALWVALAGPMVSLALAIGLLSSVHSIAHHSTVFAEIVTQLGVLNLVLALFNLLPGLPLDGGLVLKSLVWQVTGSRRRGLVVANAAGRFLSCLAVGLGTVLLLRGGGLSGTWLMLLGWFGLGAARNQDQLLRIQEALRNLRVRDASGRRFRVLEAGSTLRQLSQLEPSIPAGANPRSAITPVHHEWVLVCDRGRWRGVVTPSILQELPVQRWPEERVEDHLQPISSLPCIPESAPLWQAVLALDEPQHHRLLVLGPAGLPAGTIERPEIGEAVIRKIGLRLPPQILAAARQFNGYPLGLALPQVTRGMIASGEINTTQIQPGQVSQAR